MLSALSAHLEVILDSEDSLDLETKQKIISFFNFYKTGQWIYPGVLKRELGLSIDMVYNILSKLEQLNMVEGWYEYCCCHCQKVLGIVQRFNELPESFECESCGTEVSTIENTIKIYKVINS